MIWLIVIMCAQSGALAYLIWTVRDLRKEIAGGLAPSSEEIAELEKQAHEALAREALKNARVDQALADFGPPSPKPWPGPQALARPKLVPQPKPSPTPRPDRSAEETGAWPYEGRHAWFGDKTEALPATPSKRPE